MLFRSDTPAVWRGVFIAAVDTGCSVMLWGRSALGTQERLFLQSLHSRAGTGRQKHQSNIIPGCGKCCREKKKWDDRDPVAIPDGTVRQPWQR